MSVGELPKIELENTSRRNDVAKVAEWTTDGVVSFHCDVSFILEEDGSFSALVLNLPGAGSCGHTIEEAERNVKEAVQGVIESYRKHDEDVPWENSIACKPTEGEVARKWVLVNA